MLVAQEAQLLEKAMEMEKPNEWCTMVWHVAVDIRPLTLELVSIWVLLNMDELVCFLLLVIWRAGSLCRA